MHLAGGGPICLNISVPLVYRLVTQTRCIREVALTPSRARRGKAHPKMHSETDTIVEHTAEPIRIALADDHPVFRDGLRRLLSLESDFEVVAEAQDGTEVVDILAEVKPDVLLLDLHMPQRDGIATLSGVDHDQLKTKVIVLTASEDPRQHVHAMKQGASGIVLKQSATDLLAKSIRKVHQGGIWLDAKGTAALMEHFSDSTGDPAERRTDRSLSSREQEVVALVTQGFRNKDIANKLYVAEQTVKNHLHKIFDKLGVSDRVELALYALERKAN